ncbi:MAG: methylated-DNA--[protein]-cysteine S-methyltransferase, partial [Dehalococcoidia bacterium]
EKVAEIPREKVTTYGEVARAIGEEKAARAVGNALGKNPYPIIIPCHRVIRNTGIFGEYRSGGARKKAMLAWEAASEESHGIGV